MEKIVKRIDESGDIVDLSYFNISDEILKEIIDKIIAKEGVRELNLDGNRIGDVSPIANGLLYNSSLEKLHLYRNQIVDLSPLCEGLRYNTSLKFLSLGRNQIVDLSPLGEGLRYNTSLRQLHLSRNRIVDLSPLAEGLQHNTSLTDLWMTGNPKSGYDAWHAIKEMLNTNNLNVPNRRRTLFETMMRMLSPLE